MWQDCEWCSESFPLLEPAAAVLEASSLAGRGGWNDQAQKAGKGCI